MDSILLRKLALLCGVVTLTAPGLATCDFLPISVHGITTDPANHGDKDMDAARQTMIAFAYAAVTADGEAVGQGLTRRPDNQLGSGKGRSHRADCRSQTVADEASATPHLLQEGG